MMHRNDCSHRDALNKKADEQTSLTRSCSSAF